MKAKEIVHTNTAVVLPSRFTMPAPDIFQLPDLDDATVVEVHPGAADKPKGFCTKCGYNWAALDTQDEEGDESYDACPLCKTDMFLEEFKEDKEAYTFSPINGIRNITTGEFINTSSDYIEYEEVKPVKQFDAEAHRLKKEREEEISDLSIEEYQKVFALNGQQKAEEAFFNKVQELKKKYSK